jgi:hypothetical protein
MLISAYTIFRFFIVKQDANVMVVLEPSTQVELVSLKAMQSFVLENCESPSSIVFVMYHPLLLFLIKMPNSALTRAFANEVLNLKEYSNLMVRGTFNPKFRF